MLGDGAAHDRAGDAGDRPGAGDVGGVAAALGRRHDVADDGHSQDQQAAAAEALDGAPGDEGQDVGGGGGDDGAEQEGADRHEQGKAAATKVGELAVECGDGRGGDEIGRHDPRQERRVAEVGADDGNGGRDAGLVDGGQKHRHQDADDQADTLALGRSRSCLVLRHVDFHACLIAGGSRSGSAVASGGTLGGWWRRVKGRHVMAGLRGSGGAGGGLSALVRRCATGREGVTWARLVKVRKRQRGAALRVVRCGRQLSAGRAACVVRSQGDLMTTNILCRCIAVLLGAIWMLAGSLGRPAVGQEKAVAAQGPPLSVAVFVGSRTDVCHDRGDVAAIMRLATAEQDRINRTGGIHGRPLALKFLDDRREEAPMIANMATALADPQLLAMIGLSSSNRAEAVFKVHGPAIGRSDVPFLSDISVNKIFAAYPNVFTTRSSQEEERVPVTVSFLKSLGFERPAFLGLQGSVFSTALGDGLQAALGAGAVVSDHRLAVKDNKLDAGAVNAAVEDLKAKGADVVVVSIGTSRTGPVMKAMRAAGATPAIFMSGRIDGLPEDVAFSWPNAIYQLAWDRLPELDNDRVRQRIAKDAPEDWVFEGRKIAAAPGWATGECKERTDTGVPDPLASDNMRAIGIGAQFADMVGLIAAAGRSAERNANLQVLRARIRQQLFTSYAAGRGAYKGRFENWSFDPKRGPRRARRSS